MANPPLLAEMGAKAAQPRAAHACWRQPPSSVSANRRAWPRLAQDPPLLPGRGEDRRRPARRTAGSAARIRRRAKGSASAPSTRKRTWAPLGFLGPRSARPVCHFGIAVRLRSHAAGRNLRRGPEQVVDRRQPLGRRACTTSRQPRCSVRSTDCGRTCRACAAGTGRTRTPVISFRNNPRPAGPAGGRPSRSPSSG